MGLAGVGWLMDLLLLLCADGSRSAYFKSCDIDSKYNLLMPVQLIAKISTTR